MTCEICGKNEAIIHIRQIMGENVTDLHVCEECARKQGISGSDDKIELSLTQLLNSLVDEFITAKGDGTAEACPRCGRKIEDLRKDGLSGCADCFSAFKEEIDAYLNNVAGTAVHKGKYPKRLLTYKRLLIDKELLKRKLEAAVEEEDYERAARIRDKIEILEEKSGGIHE